MSPYEPDSFDPPLYKALGKEVRVAVLAVLSEMPTETFGIDELVTHAGISKSAFYEHRAELLELNLIRRVTAEDDPTVNGTAYALGQSQAAEALVDLNNSLYTQQSGGTDEAFRRAVDDFAE